MRLLLPPLGRTARRLLRRQAPEEAPSYEASVRAIGEARHLSEGAGARFLVIFLDSRGPEFERDRDALGRALAARGIPFVAADSLLPGADWTRLRYPRDGHWNAVGHRAVGEALASRAREMSSLRR